MTLQLGTIWFKFTLESDTTFGRGDGLAGTINAEIQHDEYGLPYLGGKTLKGLLGAECAEILWALEKCSCSQLDDWKKAALFLFGVSGGSLGGIAKMYVGEGLIFPEGTGGIQSLDGIAKMHVGDARLPEGLRGAIRLDFDALNRMPDKRRRNMEWGLKRRDNLDSLTALRRQTAMDPETGAPLRNSLRTMRVVLRKTPFIASLDFDSFPDDRSRWLLAACTKSFRRAGTGRNRGSGLLRADLYDRNFYGSQSGQEHEVLPVTSVWFDEFAKEVRRECTDVSDTTR